ncbi:MAG: NAD-dependent epimerase/dehydratase family protein [Blastocatellia bacterium]
MIDFENDQLGMPDMTYGWSKLTGEFLARHAAAKYGLDVVIYRPFSGYGEDQDFSYPFPSVVRRVGSGEAPIIVWGSGDQLRDFIYIEDAVEAVFASAHAMPTGTALNLRFRRRHIVSPARANGVSGHRPRSRSHQRRD